VGFCRDYSDYRKICTIFYVFFTNLKTRPGASFVKSKSENSGPFSFGRGELTLIDLGAVADFEALLFGLQQNLLKPEIFHLPAYPT
jgi:hypothetical protein